MPLLPADTSTPAPRTRWTLFLAVVLWAGLAAVGGYAVQQVRMAPEAFLLTPAAAPQKAPGARAATRPQPPGNLPSEPTWKQLDGKQQQALAPLQERWSGISELQKRRWLALAQTWDTRSPEEQTKLHSRMSEWASLSAQQRSQARLNYAVTKRLAASPSDKRAQWEAYQALSEEEKKRLAAKASAKPTGAAPALRPVPARKLARVPAAKEVPPNTANPPKITQPTNPRLRPLPPSVPPPSLEPLPPPPPVIVETLPIATPSAQGSALQPLEPLPEAVPGHDAGHASPVP